MTSQNWRDWRRPAVPTVLLTLVLALVGAGVLVPPASVAVGRDTPVRQLVRGGFGDGAENSYSWSMAWFKGKLYVGTARSQLCVEGATYDFYFPGKGYFAEPGPDLHCPADRYDLDLRAEIWQYTPGTDRWRMVYQAPADIPNPRAPGKYVSRDIGYRAMTVHVESDGTSALYVGGVTADEYIPEIAADNPPRLLRTTDGVHFTPLPGGPGLVDNPFGRQRAMGFRALTSYRGRLLATATGGLTGDGVLVEVTDPAGAHPRFVQRSPASLQIFDLGVLGGRLYLGAGSSDNGYSVWRTDLVGPSPRYVEVVSGGAGRGAAIDSVVSMQTYRGRLYVGASGWNSLFPGSELIRIAKDDSWEVVVGNPRLVDGAARWPVSGLYDGYGNIFNGHFWRMGRDKGGLYLGTNDWSWALRGIPLLDPLLRPGFGFDLYGTCDGNTWTTETVNAFGDGQYNYGLRTMASGAGGFFMGSANQAEGTSVFRGQHVPCSAGLRSGTAPRPTGGLPSAGRGTPAAGSPGAPAPPRAPLVQAARCGRVVSWQGNGDTTRYRVLRTERRRVAGVALTPPSRLPSGFRLPSVPRAVATSTGATLAVDGPTENVGTVRGTAFVDRTAEPGVEYRYSVVALRAGSASAPALAGRFPPTSADDVRATATRARADGSVTRGQAARVNRLLAKATGATSEVTEAAALRDLAAVVRSDRAAELGAAIRWFGRGLVPARLGCGAR